MARKPEEIKTREGRELLAYIKSQMKGYSGDKADKVATLIRDRIMSGGLPQGLSFPVGLYARQLGASRNTVSAAFKELENAGFLKGGRSTPYTLQNQRPSLPAARGLPFDLKQWAGENNLQMRIESASLVREGTGPRKVIRVTRLIGLRGAHGTRFKPTILETISLIGTMLKPAIECAGKNGEGLPLSIPDFIETTSGEYPVLSEFQIASIVTDASSRGQGFGPTLLDISFSYHLNDGPVGKARYLCDSDRIQIRTPGFEFVTGDE